MCALFFSLPSPHPPPYLPQLHSFPPSFSSFSRKVARTPVLCGFWPLWSPFVTSSGTTTAGWSSRSWGWFCCCSCWASSSTQSLVTWSRRCWGPDALVASAPSSLCLLLFLPLDSSLLTLAPLLFSSQAQFLSLLCCLRSRLVVCVLYCILS